MKLIISTYVNPDLDGVASAIVAAEYLVDDADARFEGRSTPEIAGVLSALNLAPYETHLFNEAQSPVRTMLVDCHHPAQLPKWLEPTSVTRVIDHHPDGSPEAFPNAAVQNERVGAAATLVAEAVANLGTGLGVLSASHAGLLACAIASNTLDFTAPSSTDRDLRAFDQLRLIASPDELDALLPSMAEWRSSILAGTTEAAVAHDVKVVESLVGPVAVSQLEADGARDLLTRTDLLEQVSALVEAHDSTASLLSLIDTSAGHTYLVSPDQSVRDLLTQLGPVDAAGIVELPFIALRKTHVIPALQGKSPIEPG